jgi:hypothetical protein
MLRVKLGCRAKYREMLHKTLLIILHASIKRLFMPSNLVVSYMFEACQVQHFDMLA